MYSVRHWSIRHSRLLEGLYRRFESHASPRWGRCSSASAMRGWSGRSPPSSARPKGFMFDCQMCGQCVLSSTGMSCPMNCPKPLRNGPCGGVRANGNCEVKPEMPCVWVQAWEGSRDDARRRQDPRRPEAGRPQPARDLVLAQGGARPAAAGAAGEGEEQRMTATAMDRIVDPGAPLPRICPAIPRAAGWSACCAPAISP